MNLFSLQDKVALITGGGSGIGKSISTLFAAQGAWVFILERNLDASNETAQEIIASGGRAAALVCDVSNQENVENCVATIFAQTGRVDILVNNAGVAHVANLEQTTEADLDRVYSVNVKGVYNCSRAVVKKMKEAGRGVILNMASIAASVGIADRFAYAMSKGAVLTMTYSIARDYVKHHIRCNCLSPARIHTPFMEGFIHKNYPGHEKEMFEKLSETQPIGRMGRPDEIASLALYLCSDEAGFVTGSNYAIDGGLVTLNT